MIVKAFQSAQTLLAFRSDGAFRSDTMPH